MIIPILSSLFGLCPRKSLSIGIVDSASDSIQVHYEHCFVIDLKTDLGVWLVKGCEKVEALLDALTGFVWRQYDFLNDKNALIDLHQDNGYASFEFFGGPCGGGTQLLVMTAMLNAIQWSPPTTADSLPGPLQKRDYEFLQGWFKDFHSLMDLLCMLNTIGKSSHLRGSVSHQ